MDETANAPTAGTFTRQRAADPTPEVGAAMKAFLQSTIGAGQNGLEDNGHTPISDEFESKLSTAVNAIA